MKSFTKNQLIFLLLVAIVTIAFRVVLTRFINHQNWAGVTFLSSTYGFACFFIGLVTGYKDQDTSKWQGFKFHLLTYISVNLIGLIWVNSGKANPQEGNLNQIIMLLSWGAGLVLHYVLTNKRKVDVAL